ncbi:hypothetical protein ACQP2T_01585 [Nonomuraea sp. CA-143628]|uniref:hypothetical protein n=1 Tax=Nonomuraea sp. CA-143628 TaxID=3239997 RepID=UPI003D8C4C19
MVSACGTIGSGAATTAPTTATAAAVKPKAKQPQDITAKFKKTTLANPTIKGNPQWEPIVKQITKVEYDKKGRAYKVYTKVSGDDLRRTLPGVLMSTGVGACMSAQFYDMGAKKIEVYGEDGEKGTKAIGNPGVCQNT